MGAGRVSMAPQGMLRWRGVLSPERTWRNRNGL